MKKIAILQSNYVPWKGYFDIIHDADVCVFYDCVQYTSQNWRNRNQIIVDGGKQWLTVPVRQAPLNTLISDIRIDNREPWQRRHFEILKQHYFGAEFFAETMDLLAPFLSREGALAFEYLSQFNQSILRAMCAHLGIRTQLMDSAELHLQGNGSARVLEAVLKLEGQQYISGPSGKDYLDSQAFQSAGVELRYKNYDGYPEYRQFSSRFDHQVSILDLLFHAGHQAGELIWGWRP